MKTTLIKVFLITASLLFVGCNPKANPNNETNTAALKKTLQRITQQENIDFYKKDINAWRKHFVHTEAIYWICVEDKLTLRAMGWQDLNQFVTQWMKENPKPESDSLLNQDLINDYQIELSNDIAFVRYKKNHVMPDGQTKVILESRTFVRKNTDWKIVALTSAPGYNTPNSTSNVFLH